MSSYVASLDIGSSKVCVLIAEMNRKQFNILGVGTAECKGVKKGIIVDIDATVEAIKEAVIKAEQMSNREIKSVFVNIIGGYTSLYKNKGVIAVTREDKEITQEDVKRVLQAARVISVPADKEIIDIIPEQFIVDGYEGIRDPIGMVGVRLEVDVNLVVASCTTVQSIARSIQKSGLALDGIILEPVATAAAVLNEDEKELGVALVDVGAETTDISVFKKGSLVFTKVIPVGGNHITNDISVICKISSAESEKIKKQYGVASVDLIKENEVINIKSVAGKGDRGIDLEQIGEITEARIGETLYLIRKSLEDNNLLSSLSAGIVITGGGLFNIKGIVDEASRVFELPVRLGYPNYIGVASPTYSAATGMALYELKQKRTSSLGAKPNVSTEDETAADYDGYEDDQESDGSSLLDKIKSFFKDFF